MAFRDLLKNLDVPYSLNESNSEQRTESRNLSLATCFTVLKINFLKKEFINDFSGILLLKERKTYYFRSLNESDNHTRNCDIVKTSIIPL